MKNSILIGTGTALWLVGSSVFAANQSAKSPGPVQNVNASKHPNLNAAQKLAAQAYEKLIAAQKANEWDMDGHAQKARDLLERVNAELKLAAEAAKTNNK